MADFKGLDISSLCSILPRPFVLTSTLVDIARRHFASADLIKIPDLKHLVWNPDEDTGILIESLYHWRPELTEKRPAVIVKRNAYQNQQRGIGNRRQGPPVDKEGFAHYVTYWTGSHTLFCIGGSGAQAELLGSEMERELVQFADVIAPTLQLLRFQVNQVGAVAELEEGRENWVVPITVGYWFEDRWMIRPQVPLLSNISLDFNP